MSLCRIDIQQLAPDRWAVELEAGSYSRRKRVLLRGYRNFAETMTAIDKAYGELTAPPPVKEAGPVAVFAGPDRLMGLDEDGQAFDLSKPLSFDEVVPVSRETEAEESAARQLENLRAFGQHERATLEQITEGRVLGVPVDGRWSRDRATKLLEAARDRQQTAAE